MVRSGQKRAHRRALDRHGQSVTLTTYTQTGTDSYNDPTYSESTETVTARFRQLNTPRFAREAGGEEAEADAEILVKDSVTVTDINGSRADRFTVDGTDYRVLTVENQDNGLLNCRVRRI